MLGRDEKDFLRYQSNGKIDKSLLTFYKKERERGVPHVYLAGKMNFHDVELFVDPSCLIPRLETEILVERALPQISGKAVLDLCAGSGAIGLSIKKLRPDLDVTLADVSPHAVQMCKKNAEHNSLKVEIVEGDFLAPFVGREFDAIICNPPYISMDEYEALDGGVKDFEPRIALTDEADGLLFYRKLAKDSSACLVKDGLLCMEIGKDQGEVVSSLFDVASWEVVVEKDYAGHDRFVFARKKG